MGLSFSGLPVITSAAADLIAGDVAENGARFGRHQQPGLTPFPASGEPGQQEGESADFEHASPLTALCACADSGPAAPQDTPREPALFSSLWTSAMEKAPPESGSAGPDSSSSQTLRESQPAGAGSQERLPVAIAPWAVRSQPAADWSGAGLAHDSSLPGNAAGPGLPPEQLRASSVPLALGGNNPSGPRQAKPTAPDVTLFDLGRAAIASSSGRDQVFSNPTTGTPAGQHGGHSIVGNVSAPEIPETTTNHGGGFMAISSNSPLDAAGVESDWNADATAGARNGEPASSKLVADPVLADLGTLTGSPARQSVPASYQPWASQPALQIQAVLDTLDPRPVDAGSQSLPLPASASTAPDGEVPQLGPAAGVESSFMERDGIEPRESSSESILRAHSSPPGYGVAAIALERPTPSAMTPELAPSDKAPIRDTPVPMRQGGGMPQTDAATLQQGLSGQQAQSELAFKAEIQLRQSESAVASPLTRPSQQPSTTTLVPGEIASPASPEVDAARTTLSGTNARAEHLAAAREAGFGQASSDAGADTGSPGYSAHGEGRDPLQQRTSPQLTFEPGVMNSKLTAEGGRSLKPAATLAAGQLEAVASPASPGASQPARSVALRIPNAEGGTASVVLTERAGQVQVTVRASDPALTQSLRSDLGSLAGSLEQHGFDVRVWNPSGASADREARSDSSQLSGQDDTRGQARQRHSPDDAEHRNRRQSQWSEDIE